MHRPFIGHFLNRKQDDDESYDSFEDDDDSYDSYDDDQDSSEDDDDSPQRGGRPGQRANAPPAKRPTVTSAKSSKSIPKPPSEEEKKATAQKEAARKAAFEKKAAQRERFAEERRSRGKEPVREPDEQKARWAMTAQRPRVWVSSSLRDS